MSRASFGRLPALLVVGPALGFFVLPLVYLVSMSLMERSEVVAGQYLPRQPSWSNWAAAVDAGVPGAVARSLVVALAAALLTLAISLPPAWVLARRRAGGGLLGATLLAPWMLPPIVAVVPLFVLLRSVDLNNKLAGLVLVYALVNVPITVYLLENFVRQIPEELEEAALVDGLGPAGILRIVVAPLVAPGMLATGIIVVILNYNEFLLGSFIVQRTEDQTLPVLLSLFQGDRFAHLGRMAAASLIGALPVYAIAVLGQRWLVSGLVDGSVR